jgi:CheY-like chemotaxis protein
MSAARILLVDDDDLNLEVMQAYLESEPYTIDTAHSGEIALEKVKETPPDVILLDVRMNGISGYETCALLKEDKKTRHIPVMIVTGFDSKDEVRYAIASGADDVLFKPINAQLMMLRIRRMAYQKHLYDQLHA